MQIGVKKFNLISNFILFDWWGKKLGQGIELKIFDKNVWNSTTRVQRGD